ncbi:hypothetical protein BC829DRAFT_422632 [Chytridium lagenaria]|nr:hypothetical protein BC829DRAFT_422632 [Chytridium lagenaria]
MSLMFLSTSKVPAKDYRDLKVGKEQRKSQRLANQRQKERERGQQRKRTARSLLQLLGGGGQITMSPGAGLLNEDSRHEIWNPCEASLRDSAIFPKPTGDPTCPSLLKGKKIASDGGLEGLGDVDQEEVRMEQSDDELVVEGDRHGCGQLFVNSILRRIFIGSILRRVVVKVASNKGPIAKIVQGGSRVGELISSPPTKRSRVSTSDGSDVVPFSESAQKRRNVDQAITRLASIQGESGSGLKDFMMVQMAREAERERVR